MNKRLLNNLLYGALLLSVGTSVFSCKVTYRERVHLRHAGK